MSTLGERIKFAREQKKILQADLAKLISVKSAGVISNWEKDLNKPDAEKIVKLCDVLNVSVSYLLDYYGKSEFEINSFEQDYIKKYRLILQYSPNGAETVNYILNREYAVAKQIQEQADILAAQAARISELEAAHKQTTMEQAAAIIGYERATSNLYLYSYMGKIACAGTGFYFDDIPIDTMEAPYMKDADFIIGVNGDSMEPDYHDGDKLYVKKAEELIPGDVGIFTVNDECFLKEFGNEGLISKNPKYNNIPGTEDVVLIGRVIGKVDEK